MGFLCTRRSWAGVLCAVLLSSSMPLVAARKTTPPPLLPAPFRDAIEKGVANGAYSTLAVGLIDGKQSGTFYFGHRDGSDSKPADDKSLFEIGAVSEVFTGLLLTQAAIEGRLRFSDPIEKFLPVSFPFADARFGKITLAQLATQHSGLSARPANLFPADPNDPYADYAAEDLLALLALSPPNTRQNADDYGYSVLNAGLLGHLLGRVYQMPLAEALATKVLAPLGLKRLVLDDDPALLHGYAHGEAAPHWHYGVLGGAAGLRASLPDLLSFLQHNLTPDDSPLRAALLLARQPHTDGPTDQLGFGWNVRESIDGTATWPLVWRASQTAGFTSFIGFRTDQQKGIVLLGNAAEDVAALGIAWLSDKLPPSAPHGSTAVKGGHLDGYPGLYQIATGVEAIVRVDDDTMSLQMPGELPLRMRAADKDVFVADRGELGASFMRDIDEVNGVLLHFGASNISATRLSRHAPHLARTPIACNAAALDAMVGDYRFDDQTWIRVGKSAQNPNLQWTLAARRTIFCYAPDRYVDADGAIDVQLMRDGNGRNVGIRLDLAGARREAAPLRRTTP